MASLTLPPAASIAWRAATRFTPQHSITMRSPRSRSLSLTAIRSTIRLPYARPSRIIAPVQRLHPCVHVVLGTLTALHESRVAARDHAHDQLGRRAERRRALARVEHAEAAGGARAHVHQAPPLLKRGDHEIDRPGDVAAHGMHRLGHRGIFGVDQIHDLERRGDIDALRAGIPLLGEARIEVIRRRNGHHMVSGGPKLDVDPNSGQRAQFDMRRSLVVGLLALAGCGGGVKPPETNPALPATPVPPAAAAPLPAPGAPPAPGPRPGPAAAGPLLAPAWPLTQRASA